MSPRLCMRWQLVTLAGQQNDLCWHLHYSYECSCMQSTIHSGAGSCLVSGQTADTFSLASLICNLKFPSHHPVGSICELLTDVIGQPAVLLHFLLLAHEQSAQFTHTSTIEQCQPWNQKISQLLELSRSRQ